MEKKTILQRKLISSFFLKVDSCYKNPGRRGQSTKTIKDNQQMSRDSFDPQSLCGQVLTDRFSVSDTLIGNGSFGLAYLCVDNENESESPTCVVKFEVEPTRSCVYPKFGQLEHEFQVYKHLWHHPKLKKHLPQVFLYSQHVISPKHVVRYLVMERVGVDLLSYLDVLGQDQYKVHTLGRFGIQMVSALRFMHDMFIVHRDIKPQNIMVVHDAATGEETIKLIDFGLSTPIAENNLSETDRDRFRSTTCTYMFASWRQHFGHVCSQRTDMEAFLYSWFFLAGTSLPWQDTPDTAADGSPIDRCVFRQTIGHIKRSATVDSMVYVFDAQGPDVFGTTMAMILSTVLKMKYDDTPPYKTMTRYFSWLATLES